MNPSEGRPSLPISRYGGVIVEEMGFEKGIRVLKVFKSDRSQSVDR